MERRTYTVEDVGRVLGIGRNSMYKAVERGDVRCIRIGKRIVIPKAEVERLLHGGMGSDGQAA